MKYWILKIFFSNTIHQSLSLSLFLSHVKENIVKRLCTLLVGTPRRWSTTPWPWETWPPNSWSSSATTSSHAGSDASLAVCASADAVAWSTWQTTMMKTKHRNSYYKACVLGNDEDEDKTSQQQLRSFCINGNWWWSWRLIK